MAKKKAPIDPLDGPKMALAGDIVAMDDALNVTRNGRLYLEKGAIVAIRRATDPAPAGFENVSVLNTGGTMFPGLIELHNHLAYNALRLWQVPKKYNNRDQWSGIPEYRKLVSGPMTVVGKSPGLLPASHSLCRSEVPRRRRHDESRDRALQQRRHSTLLPGNRAQCRGDGRREPARSRDTDR